jgi:hypothetical protein
MKRKEKGIRLYHQRILFCSIFEIHSYNAHYLTFGLTKNSGTQISAMDFAGHGVFRFLAGVGGEEWKEAAKVVSGKRDVQIQTF